MNLRISTCVLQLLFFVLFTQAILACTENNKFSQVDKAPTKISSNLLSVINRLESDSSSEKDKGLSHETEGARMDKEGRIQIYITVYHIDDIILEDLEKTGVKIDIYDTDENLVQGWANPEKIKAISEFPYVKSVDLPTYGVSN
jgi:hypothetical protein